MSTKLNSTVVLMLIALASCGEASERSAVETCVRNSDCTDPVAMCVDGLCVTECGDNRDCDEGLVCREGFCVEDVHTCRADQDCSYGAQCVQGVCEIIEGFCLANRDCELTMQCDRATQRCIEGDPLCTSAGDCFAGEECVEARCTVSADGCVRNSDCSSFRVCAGGRCVDECLDDRDCARDEICDRGRCEPAPVTNNGNNPPNNVTNNTTNNVTNNTTNNATNNVTNNANIRDDQYAGSFQLSSNSPIQRCNELISINYDARTVVASQDGSAYSFVFPQSVYHGFVTPTGYFQVSWSGSQGFTEYCGEANSSNTYTGTFQNPDFFTGTLQVDFYYQIGACNCSLIYNIVGTRL